jgi:paraquat-inducible protein B
MKKRTRPTLIGAFVVGAIALAVAAVIAFGSGRLFAERYTWVAFFDGSVFGLSEGAPVICRGVRVGTVTGIELLGDREKNVQIAVIFETEPESVHVLSHRSESDPPTRMKRMIENGLRARLEMQSFLTRQLMLVLDFHPDTPIRLVGIDMGYPEVPTIRSGLQELLETVERLPLEEIANSIRNALEGIEEVVHSARVTESLEALRGTLLAAENLVRRLDAKVDPLTENLEATLADARKLLRDVNAEVGPLAAGLEGTLAAARQAIGEAEGTITGLQKTAGEDSALVHALTEALNELSAASRSLRTLAESLESQPESVLRGKRPSGGK